MRKIESVLLRLVVVPGNPTLRGLLVNINRHEEHSFSDEQKLLQLLHSITSTQIGNKPIRQIKKKYD